MKKKSLFCYNNSLVYTKRILSFILFIIFMVLSVKINHDYCKIKTILALILAHSCGCFLSTFGCTSVHIFLKISSKCILHNFLYAERIDT